MGTYSNHTLDVVSYNSNQKKYPPEAVTTNASVLFSFFFPTLQDLIIRIMKVEKWFSISKLVSGL